MRLTIVTALVAASLAGASLCAQAPTRAASVGEAVEQVAGDYQSVTAEIGAIRESVKRLPVVAASPVVVAAADSPPAATIDVSIQGPSAVPSGGFALVGVGPADAVLRWRIEKPDGAAEPLRLRDESGAPVLAFFSPTPGRYVVTLTAQVPMEGLDPFGEATHVVVVGGVPPKPPGPEPVPPEPTPDVDPVPGQGFRVILLYETDSLQTMPASQVPIFTAGDVRSYLKSKTPIVNGVPEFRVWDDDYTAERMAYETPEWRAAYERAKTDANGRLPWLLILRDSAVLASEPLPANVADTLTLLRKHGGN